MPSFKNSFHLFYKKISPINKKVKFVNVVAVQVHFKEKITIYCIYYVFGIFWLICNHMPASVVHHATPPPAPYTAVAVSYFPC